MLINRLKAPALFVTLVVFAMLSRLLPHAPNLAAVAAVAMFAGWFFHSRLLAISVPLTAMLLSDALIGGYQPAIMVAVYLSFIAPVFFRGLIGRDLSAARLLARAGIGALAASTLFFISTNLAVWAFAGYYPLTAPGLAACFAAALPFFRHTLAGDLVFTSFLFGSFILLTRLMSARSAVLTIPNTAVAS